MNEAWATINIAISGGWPPSEMDAMALEEFTDWYETAVEILEAQKAQAP